MSKNAPRRPGRPTIEIDPLQLEKLAARWMTKDAAADFMGISRGTLHNRMKEKPELEAAWARGRAMLQANAMDWLIASAQRGDVKAQMFLAERVCGLSPKAIEQDAASHADETAQHVRDALRRMVTIEQGATIDHEPLRSAQAPIIDQEGNDAPLHRSTH